MSNPIRTITELADAIIAQLDTSYDLVYVAHDDKLTDSQTAALVRGNMETLWSELEDFESDSRYEATKTIIADSAATVVSEWETTDDAAYPDLVNDFERTGDYDRVRFTIEERDTSDWARQLADNTPPVLLRIGIDTLDEDHAFNNEPVLAVDVISRLDIDDTDDNRKTIQYALDNASPENSVLMGYWIVGADVSALYDLPLEGDVEITNPHLYLGNPFAGSGLITEEPLTATVTVKRSDLRTDKDAFGYAVEEVYGGLNASSFTATIRAAQS